MVSITPRSYFDFTPLRSPSIFADMDDFFSFPDVSAGNDFSISEDDKHMHVDAALPGVKPEDIEVTFDKGVVWIRGQAREEEKMKKRKIYRNVHQTFSYRITIPGDIDMKAEPQASYENGMVRITLAKAPQSQPKKLTIKLNGKRGKELQD
ncbi:MAG TPA: Hsp20/alpha crystallin family protein [Patescibacteria group bacterium]|nr:Hsp20/alpha crystallin family protein [Patescibacteria group bacterium]